MVSLQFDKVILNKLLKSSQIYSPLKKKKKKKKKKKYFFVLFLVNYIN